MQKTTISVSTATEYQKALVRTCSVLIVSTLLDILFIQNF